MSFCASELRQTEEFDSHVSKRLETTYMDDSSNVIKVGDVVTIRDTLYGFYVTGEVTNVFSKTISDDMNVSPFALAIADYYADWSSFVTKDFVSQHVNLYTLIPGELPVEKWGNLADPVISDVEPWNVGIVLLLRLPST